MQSGCTLPAYSVKGRRDVAITFSQRNGIPAQPFELRGLVSEDEYYRRMESLMSIVGKYGWTVFERIFIGVASFFTFVVPIVLSQVLTHIFISKDKAANPLATDEILFELEEHSLVKARAIAVGAMLGILFLLWVPYFIFKGIGSRRTAALLLNYDKQDAALGLRWTVASVSLFTRSATLVIILPPTPPPSNFHPQAYLPEYMASSATKDTQGMPQYALPVVLPVNDGFYDEKV